MIIAGVVCSKPVGTSAGQLIAQLLHACKWMASYCCEELPAFLCKPAPSKMNWSGPRAHSRCLQHWPPALANADCSHCTCACACQASFSRCPRIVSSSKCGAPHADKR